MTAKPRYICCFTFLAVLLGSACELSDSTETKVILSSSHHAVGVEFTDVHRHLRVSVAKQDYDYEERAILDLSKVKELTQKGSKNIKKLAETAKTKLNQHVADLRFAKLDKVKSDVFGSSEFEKWAASVTKMYKNNPDAADVAMVTALASHYGDDGLAAMLTAAKQVAGTKTTATRLGNAHWMAEGRTTENVYKLLKLDEAGENLLKKPELDAWISFTAKLGKDPYDLLLFKLKPRYDDVGLANMLIRAKNDPTTKTIAEKLETLHLEKWLKQKKSTTDVFKILKLNEEGSTLLKSPVLNTWKAYVKMLNKDPDELLFLALKQTGVDGAAAEMEKLLVKKWSTAGKSGDDIFRLLGLKKEGDRVFESPVWSTWVAYLNKHEADADKALLTVLRAQYGDERLTELVAKASKVTSTKEITAKLQLDVWHMNGQTSDEVFNILKLNKMGDELFESPELRTWVTYVRKLNSNARPNEFSAITQLEQRFGTAELARMLASSKDRVKNTDTKEFLLDLQDLQFKRWMNGNKDPTDVSEMLAKSSQLPKGDNAKVIHDYQAYFTAYAD